jgi:hypothetical protein
MPWSWVLGGLLCFGAGWVIGWTMGISRTVLIYREMMRREREGD